MSRTSGTAVHLVTPSVLHSSIGCGGTSLYRGVAIACTSIGPTWCHELAHPAGPGDLTWRAPGVRVRTHLTVADLVRALRHSMRPGDIVGKWLNAAGPQDARVDVAIAELADAVGARSYYLDPEPFVRMPLIRDNAHYLWDLLPSYDGVILFAGGDRAVGEYGHQGESAVSHVSAGLGYLAHQSAGPASSCRAAITTPARDVDLIVTVALQSEREHRVVDLLERLASRRPGTTAHIIGGIDAAMARPPEVQVLPPRDPVTLLEHYGRSRFTVNMLRPDFGGYSHTPAARVFEAVHSGSCLVTDAFPGLSDYLTPDEECLVDVDRIETYLDLPEETRQDISARAVHRIDRHVEVERRRIVEVLTASPGHRRAMTWRPGAARAQLDIRRRCAGRRVAVLDDATPWIGTARRLGPATVDTVGSVSEVIEGGYEIAVTPAAAKAELDRATPAGGPPRTTIVTPPYSRTASVRMVWGRDWLMPGCEASWADAHGWGAAL